MINRVKGTRDILDCSMINFMRSSLSQHLTCYSYSEIELPIIEPADLFKRSLGVFSDVVSKEMFMIHPVKADEKPSICLRPEATAQTMRAFFNENIAYKKPLPWKVFTFGPMFRYERPQKGRWRQFYQMSIEVIGAKSIAYDAQLITMLDRYFGEKLALDNYVLKLNYIGSPEDRKKYKDVLYKFLSKHEDSLSELAKKQKEVNVLRIFDTKDENLKKLLEDAPKITDYLSSESKEEWERLRMLLEQLSVSYVHDPYLVRGLDYYNKTVFEFTCDDLGAQNAFCGGGRYDYLSTTLGSKTVVPALGAALGVGRLALMLEEHKDRLPVLEKPCLTVVIPMTQDQEMLALLVADQLRAKGICVETILDQASPKNMLSKAHKMGTCRCILIGSDEVAGGYVTVKNMMTGEQKKVAQKDIVDFCL